MEVLNFRDFMKKYNLENDTTKESQLQRIYNYPIYPKDSKIYSDKGFINIDDGSMGGSHWTCVFIKVKNHTTLIRLEVNQINFY